MNKKYITIFNEQEAKFYIMHDIFPIQLGYHHSTGAKFYTFIRQQTKPLFDKWCKRVEN